MTNSIQVKKLAEASLERGGIVSEPQFLAIAKADKNGWDTVRIHTNFDNFASIHIMAFMRGERERCITLRAELTANGGINFVDYFYNGRPFKRSEVSFLGEERGFYYNVKSSVEREVVASLMGNGERGVKTVINTTIYNDIFLSPNGLNLNQAINAFA